jgi:hypothetical protein
VPASHELHTEEPLEAAYEPKPHTVHRSYTPQNERKYCNEGGDVHAFNFMETVGGGTGLNKHFTQSEDRPVPMWMSLCPISTANTWIDQHDPDMSLHSTQKQMYRHARGRIRVWYANQSINNNPRGTSQYNKQQSTNTPTDEDANKQTKNTIPGSHAKHVLD